MKFVALHICNLLNISLKYMKHPNKMYSYYHQFQQIHFKIKIDCTKQNYKVLVLLKFWVSQNTVTAYNNIPRL